MGKTNRKISQQDLATLAEMLSKLASGTRDSATVKKFMSTLRTSVRVNRKGLSLSGEGLAELLLKTAPLIPVRDAATIQAQHGGMNGPALAGAVIRVSSRNSAAVGGVTGAMASMHQLAPPFWIMLPLEVIVETLIVSAIEMKMIAELHELYGRPITGTKEERGLAIVESWASRKGIDLESLRGQRSVSSALGKNAGSQIMQMLRRKLMARAARNISSLAPLLIGAVAGAELNRRSTRDIGNAIVLDLSKNK